MYTRTLNLEFVSQKSCFLFGPRQTGKSFLLKHRFPNALYLDLLHSNTYRKYLKNPSVIREEIYIYDKTKLIIIDEIQKLPILLNEVHALIEEGYKFILTGSSARKLKRGAANLLGGRARTRNLFPLTSKEITDFDLLKVINIGSLPSIYMSDDPLDDLAAYIGTYLKEEIVAEALIRGIEDFSNFIEMAAVDNTELINFSNIASDLGVSSNTIKNYYQILEDTLVGNLLPAYRKTIKRKAITKSKFYFFDVGVANFLAGRFKIENHSEVFGKCFEHFIFCELKAYLSYTKDRRLLSFWRSKNGQEVDFIIGDDIAIEVKSTKNVLTKHTKGIKALSQEVDLKVKIIISQDTSKRLLDDNIIVYPVSDFLEELWMNKLT